MNRQELARTFKEQLGDMSNKDYKAFLIGLLAFEKSIELTAINYIKLSNVYEAFMDDSNGSFFSDTIQDYLDEEGVE
jgi:transcriptional regulator NrdR family protein